MTAFQWTEENLALVRKMATDPSMPSVSAIANAIGANKNQVSGKLNRMKEAGLIPDRQSNRDAQRDRYFASLRAGGPRRVRQRRRETEPTTLAPAVPVPAAGRRNRPPVLCCWPMWGPEERAGRYCNAEVTNHRTYCREHAVAASGRAPATEAA